MDENGFLNQELDVELVKVIGKYLENPYFLDVGAEKGRIACELYKIGLKGDLVDPLPRHAGVLQAMAEEHGGNFFQLALADVEGVRPFHIAEDAAGNELDYFHSLQLINPQEQFRHGRSIEVQCRRIDQMVKEGLLPERIGILKTDTEGNDFFVLQGLGNVRPELVVCEFFEEQLYSGWPYGRAEVLLRQMQELGYRHYYAVKRFSRWSSLLVGPAPFKPQDWGNLFFVNESLFERSSKDVLALMRKHEMQQLVELEALHADWQAKERVIQQLVQSQEQHKNVNEAAQLAPINKDNQDFRRREGEGALDRRLISALQSALKLDVLVETGSSERDALASLSEFFTALHLIGLSPECFAAAQARCTGNTKISVYQGNPAEKLKQIRAALPADGVLYFLGAHRVLPTNTAGEASQCPLLDEIAAIGPLGAGSVIVIDDARLFLAPPPTPDEISLWPNLEQVSCALREIGPEHQMKVADDLILFYPAAAVLAVSRFAAEHGGDWLEIMSKIRDYDNLRNKFDELQAQLTISDREKLRLEELATTNAPCHRQIEKLRQLAEQQQAAIKEEVPCSSISEKHGEQQNALLSALVAKERVIEELSKALAAYRAAMPFFSPFIILVKIWRFVWSKTGKSTFHLFRPGLGCLSQHPPRVVRLPAYYWQDIHLTEKPKVSIVTPSYNQAEFIARTIGSVLSQGYSNIEYYIQDGGSKDGTTDVIREYEERIQGWVSAPDGGQSQAINMGFAKTTGEIMAWLNSDDLLLPGAIAYIVDYFNKNPDIDVIYGHRIIVDERDQEIGRWVLPRHNNEVLSWADFVPQETLFWRRRIWERVGGKIDESFRFAMDWDLLLRFRNAGARMARLPRYLGAFRIHGLQKTSAEIGVVGMQEMDRLRERELGRVVSFGEIRRALLGYMLVHSLLNVMHRLVKHFSRGRSYRP